MVITSRTVCFVVALLISTGFQASAATYHVSPTGDDQAGAGSADQPYASIQHALEQAQPGDTVLVAAGVYRESLEIPRSGEPGKPITLRGAEGADVVLDGSRVITGWQACAADEPGLTVAGVAHPQATKIYKAAVDAKAFGPARDQLYEVGVRSRIAREPNQQRGEGLDTGLLADVASEAHGKKDRLADPVRFDPTNAQSPWHATIKGLTAEKLSEYFKDATAHVWMRRNGNYMEAKTITGFADDAVLLDSALRRDLVAGDRYSIIHHPHALDEPGEFYVSRQTDDDGNYTVYYWPRSVDSLESEVSFPVLGRGLYAQHRDHIVIDGLHVRLFRGEGIFFRRVVGTDGHNNDVHVRRCTVTDVGASGIYLQQTTGSSVTDCNVWRAGGRGIFATTGKQVTFARNTVGDTDSTCISFYGITQGQIIDNRIHGAVGVHSNGSSCYLGCRDLLIARNIYYNGANATFQNIVNFTVFANVFDGQGGGSMIAIWPNSRNSNVATRGDMLFLNNTAIRASRHIAAIFRYETIELHNNLIGGSASTGAVAERSHNGWLGRFGNQSEAKGWQLGEGSWAIPPGPRPGSPTEADYARIFKTIDADAPAKLDYRLAGTPETNPAVHAGRDVQQLLETKGVKANFPDFDFTVDLAGKPWADTPSMGAYEYQR